MAQTKTKDEKRNTKSILAQISNVQKSLHEQYYRVEVLEKALAFRDMTNDERDQMEAELEAIKRILAENEDNLKQLQKVNRKTASVAGLFIILCVASFLLYTLISNPYH